MQLKIALKMEAARLLLLVLLPLAIGLPMEPAYPRESINFANGFPGNFAEGLPTDEFKGALPGLSRSKRQLQLGVSQHIAEMLATPYQGPHPTDITSLFQRNSLVRPVRQSLSSDSSRRFPQPFTPKPSNKFFGNFVQQTVREPVTKRPVHQSDRRHVPPPTRPPVQRTTQRRPQQNFSPESQFPSFSEAQAEHKRTNEENINHFTNVEGFFESSRIRNRRDVTSRQGIASQIDSIISSPFNGPIPSSRESLFSRNTKNRVPRKTSDKQQSSSSKPISPVDTSDNHQPFTFPFKIPNLFKHIGIRRHSLGAEDRQGVSGGIDAILSTPYGGTVPASIESLLFRDRNLQKRNPQPFIRPTPQQNSHSQNQQNSFLNQNIVVKRNPEPFIRPTSQQNSNSQNQQKFIFNQNVVQPFIQSTSQPQFGFQSQPKPQTILNHQDQIQPEIQTNPHNKLIPLSQSQSVTSNEPKTDVHSVGQPNTHQSIRPSHPELHSGFRPSRSQQLPLANNNQQFHSNRFSSSSYQLIYPSSHVNVQHGRKKRDIPLVNSDIIRDLPYSRSDFYPAVHPSYLNGKSIKGKPIHQFEREFVKNHFPHHSDFFGVETNFLKNIEETKQSTRNTPLSTINPPFVRRVRQPSRIGPSRHPRFDPSQRAHFGPRRSQFPHNLLPPAFKPGPSPPAHILPPTSIRSPRHTIRENKHIPRVNRQEDIPVNRRSMLHIGDPLSDAPGAEGREDKDSHAGFMTNNFPSFQFIGGFAKMSDEPDQSSNSFVPAFNPPQISIPDIQEDQPRFSIPSHFAQQRLDTSEPLYPEELASRSRVAPWIFREQFFEDETNLQPLETELSRKRRRAGEPDPIDPSQIPHKRVPRVGIITKSTDDESLIPHVRVPRQHKESDLEKTGSELLMTKIPLTSISRSSHVPFESFPDFNFPTFESERLSDRLSHAKFIPKRFTSEFGSSLRNPSTSESDHILPEGQRLYPTYNPRRHPFPPSSNKPFFPPAPRQPGPPGPRPHFNAHATTRGPSTRGSTFRPSHGPSTGPKGFRDFHDTFYGPDYGGGREAIHRPDFHFPSTQPHREHEYPNENSLLGSGNFEILRGGTFYEPGDYHLNHHPYDHLLDGGYSPFHSNSHSNNYVDDFFSNFRDFSEFAARSDSGEGEYHGFSEPITSIVDPNRDMDHTGEESSIKETQAEPNNKTNNSKDEVKSKKADKNNTINNKSPSHRPPKNIQEVLEEIDPRPNNHSTSELTVDEKDPMIAMY